MGKVEGIATRPKKRAQMELSESASISFHQGVGNDSRGKFKNHRQVTVIEQESWTKACDELDAKLDWTLRRANILVSGMSLKNATGRQLKIGNFLLEITGELEPCYRMDEQFLGLTKALVPDWRGGVTCKILSEGEVNLGDDVVLL